MRPNFKKSKNSLSIFSLIIIMFISFNATAQKDNDKRKSPHTTVKQTLASGAEISFFYGQPQVKGRIIGKDLEPKDGKVWRTGADEATVFETSKPVKINGKELPAGKYSFFTISDKDVWTLVFNKTWDQWGAYEYKEKEDALRVQTKVTNGTFNEKLAFTVNHKGEAFILWGDKSVGFMIE
jgi:Protein of unknown function (DUF2911)